MFNFSPNPGKMQHGRCIFVYNWVHLTTKKFIKIKYYTQNTPINCIKPYLNRLHSAKDRNFFHWKKMYWISFINRPWWWCGYKMTKIPDTRGLVVNIHGSTRRWLEWVQWLLQSLQWRQLISSCWQLDTAAPEQLQTAATPSLDSAHDSWSSCTARGKKRELGWCETVASCYPVQLLCRS